MAKNKYEKKSDRLIVLIEPSLRAKIDAHIRKEKIANGVDLEKEGQRPSVADVVREALEKFLK